eukprot:5987134-Prymnesium_polylepis.1
MARPEGRKRTLFLGPRASFILCKKGGPPWEPSTRNHPPVLLTHSNESFPRWAASAPSRSASGLSGSANGPARISQL